MTYYIIYGPLGYFNQLNKKWERTKREATCYTSMTQATLDIIFYGMGEEIGIELYEKEK